MMALAQRSPALAHKKRGGFATGGTATVNVSPDAGGTVGALSFVPAPGDASGAAAGTATPAVPYTSSAPATPPSFGPVIAQINSQGIPQSTPSATLPDSSGKQIAMYQPSSYVNPLSLPPGSTPPPAATPAAAPAAPAAPKVTLPTTNPTQSGLYGIQNGQYVGLNYGNPGNSYTSVGGNASYDPSQQYFTGNGMQGGSGIGQSYWAPDYYTGTVYSSAGSGAPTPVKRGGAIKKFAVGGIPTSEAMSPWYMRQAERQMIQPEGLINSMGAGRTDIHNMNVPSGSYVMPADVVSGLGEGNTMAGANVIDKMMHSMPYGIQEAKLGHGRGPPPAPAFKLYNSPPALPASETEKRGGAPKSNHGEPVPIVVAGGEVLLHPGTIIQKFGDLKKGHAILDKFVLNARKKNIEDTKKLKGPKR